MAAAACFSSACTHRGRSRGHEAKCWGRGEGGGGRGGRQRSETDSYDKGVTKGGVIITGMRTVAVQCQQLITNYSVFTFRVIYVILLPLRYAFALFGIISASLFIHGSSADNVRCSYSMNAFVWD